MCSTILEAMSSGPTVASLAAPPASRSRVTGDTPTPVRHTGAMRVSGILASKGSTVATITPGTTIAEAAEELRLRSVGALVVSLDGSGIQGIVSERDLVRRLAERGAHALEESVDEIMTADVRTCAPDDHVDDLMGWMTEHRVRHLPVIEDGGLAGIISIGDVVKWRVTELEDETKKLHDYITTGR